ncbi:MAG: hypothetical protein ACM3RP_11450 [Chitinophagales bacterium]
MAHEVALIGVPGPDVGPGTGGDEEWRAFQANAVARLRLILAQLYPGEVTVRGLAATAPEVEAYPEAKARLAEAGVRLPLVLIDGHLVREGAFSAGIIAAYLRDGQIPKSP